jgi:S1-C subfamily serine protease
MTRGALVAVCAMSTWLGTACHHQGATAAAPELKALTPQDIAERALPSIVLIRGVNSLGTGFVVWQDGRIATNLHVIADTPALEVELPDGRRIGSVEVMAVDEQHDLAVIRIPMRHLPALTLGDSDDAKPGERVVAIGHPLGLGNTVSDGLISAVRELGPDAKVLQISAPITEGSSGGPVIDDHGLVVGVAFMVSERGQNLNFAVPVDYLKPLLMSDKATPFVKWASAQPRPTADAPPVKRQIPTFPISMLDDCPLDQMKLVYGKIGEAISLGAPLYNQGNHAACFKIYEGTALDLEQTLKGCAKVKQAFADGRSRAGALAGDTEKAWAMRDTFDGLVDVLERKVQSP